MRDLITEPMWRPEDLGLPIPDSDHAVSVAMPLWQHVVGYEEKVPEIVEKLQCGYPRFFMHPEVVKLNARAEDRLAGNVVGEQIIGDVRQVGDDEDQDHRAHHEKADSTVELRDVAIEQARHPGSESRQANHCAPRCGSGG